MYKIETEDFNLQRNKNNKEKSEVINPKVKVRK